MDSAVFQSPEGPTMGLGLYKAQPTPPTSQPLFQIPKSDCSAPESSYSPLVQFDEIRSDGPEEKLDRIVIQVPKCHQGSSRESSIQLDPVRYLLKWQIPAWALLAVSSESMSSILPKRTATRTSRLGASTFFHGDCPQLSRVGHGPGGNVVLVARFVNLSEVNTPFCVVEMLKPGLYSIVRLAAGVTAAELMDWKRASRKALTARLGYLPEPSTALSTEWWRSAALNFSPSQIANPPVYPSKRSALLMNPASSSNVLPSLTIPTLSAESKASHTLSAVERFSKPDTALVQEYLSTLYLTRSSLALFAKGPLGRARTEFEGRYTELAQLLRKIAISVKQMDTKFGETVPKLLQNGKVKRKRSTRKDEGEIKRRKDGLLDGEAEMVLRWWNKQQDQMMGVGEDGEVNADGDFGDLDELSVTFQMNKAVRELRTREALAQIVLLMEILVIEREVEKSKVDTPLATSEGSTKHTEGTSKRTNKVDIELALDLLADRLCIWQSVEDTMATAIAPSSSSDKPGSADVLRDFCVDVILPFYKVRLASVSSSVAKKFGWANSPLKRSVPKSQAPQPPLSLKKPGAAIERLPPGAAIERLPPGAAKDTKSVDSRNRLASLKNRSVSQSRSLSLMSSSRAGGRSTLSRASSIVSTSSSVSRFKAREVDLEAMSAAATAKLEHRKRVDSELRDNRRKPQPLARSESAMATTAGEGQSRSQSQSRSTLQRYQSTITNPRKRPNEATKDVHVQGTPMKRNRTMAMPPPVPSDFFNTQPVQAPSQPGLFFASQPVFQPPSPVTFSQPAHRFDSAVPPDFADCFDVIGDTPQAKRKGPAESPVAPIPFLPTPRGRHGRFSPFGLDGDEDGEAGPLVFDTPTVPASKAKRARDEQFGSVGPIAFDLSERSAAKQPQQQRRLSLSARLSAESGRAQADRKGVLDEIGDEFVNGAKKRKSMPAAVLGLDKGSSMPEMPAAPKQASLEQPSAREADTGDGADDIYQQLGWV